MKKHIFTANLIALMILVPAVIVGYLKNEGPKDSSKESVEIVKDASAHRDDVSILQLVRTF